MDDNRSRFIKNRLNIGDPMSTLTNNQVIRVLNECHVECEQLTTFLLDLEDLNKRRRQMKLLRDCESLCVFTAGKLAASSYLSASLLKLVAITCEHCGHECGQFEDPMSQKCSKMCYSCAKLCREAIGN